MLEPSDLGVCCVRCTQQHFALLASGVRDSGGSSHVLHLAPSRACTVGPALPHGHRRLRGGRAGDPAGRRARMAGSDERVGQLRRRVPGTAEHADADGARQRARRSHSPRSSSAAMPTRCPRRNCTGSPRIHSTPPSTIPSKAPGRARNRRLGIRSRRTSSRAPPVTSRASRPAGSAANWWTATRRPR